ncbi:hypothetical protein B484DRAFT_467690 [Ochromonadaceae sp. CCMP2298]|nr:hypothetical protein B484DRAFT_467690 [Ochromonadaceae sp. CCMP2298]
MLGASTLTTEIGAFVTPADTTPSSGKEERRVTELSSPDAESFLMASALQTTSSIEFYYRIVDAHINAKESWTRTSTIPSTTWRKIFSCLSCPPAWARGLRETPEEKTARLLAQDCYLCGETGHISRACPWATKFKEMKAASLDNQGKAAPGGKAKTTTEKSLKTKSKEKMAAAVEGCQDSDSDAPLGCTACAQGGDELFNDWLEGDKGESSAAAVAGAIGAVRLIVYTTLAGSVLTNTSVDDLEAWGMSEGRRRRAEQDALLVAYTSERDDELAFPSKILHSWGTTEGVHGHGELGSGDESTSDGGSMDGDSEYGSDGAGGMGATSIVDSASAPRPFVFATANIEQGSEMMTHIPGFFDPGGFARVSWEGFAGGVGGEPENQLYNFVPRQESISLGNAEHRVQSYGRGSLGPLRDVMYAPGMSFSMVSVSALGGRCVIVGREKAQGVAALALVLHQEAMITATLSRKQYHVDVASFSSGNVPAAGLEKAGPDGQATSSKPKKVVPYTFANNSKDIKGSFGSTRAGTTQGLNALELLHLRNELSSEAVLKAGLMFSIFRGAQTTSRDLSTLKPMQEIGMDPVSLSTKTVDGNTVLNVDLCYATKMMWAYPAKTGAAQSDVLRAIKRDYADPYGHVIETVRLNSGSVSFRPTSRSTACRTPASSVYMNHLRNL